MYRHVGHSKGRIKKWSGCSKGKGKKSYETYSICPRHGIDRESFRHDDVSVSSIAIAEENRPEQEDVILRGHSPSVTEDVTIMSQEGFQLSSGAALAQHRLPPLRLAPLELNLFFFFSPSS
jgi:hypothetical protein